MLATNENKLKHGFNSLFNTSVYQYVIGIRVEKAIELMRTGDISIDQISGMVGYASLAHFTCAFKKMKGVSPRSLEMLCNDSVLTPWGCTLSINRLMLGSFFCFSFCSFKRNFRD